MRVTRAETRYESGVEISGIINFFFFFFQAEDGIRDVAVTGVQTCALPILTVVTHDVPHVAPPERVTVKRIGKGFHSVIASYGFMDDPRSEEHTSELQSRLHIVCRLLLVKKKCRLLLEKKKQCLS